MYTYICIYTYTYICLYTYIYAKVYAFIYTHTFTYISPPKKYIHKLCKHLIIRENFSTSGAITNWKEYLAR